jgi:hypothetical protein
MGIGAIRLRDLELRQGTGDPTDLDREGRTVSDDGVDHEHESMRFWINSNDPQNPMITSYVVGLEQIRLRARRSLIITSAILVIVVFCVALAFGSYHVPWYLAVVDGLMMVGAVASGILTGSIWGEYRMLERISKARMTVQVHDVERDPGDE